MILLIHQNAEKGLKVLQQKEELSVDSRNLCQLFWKLAEDHPGEIIVWVEESLQKQVDLEAVQEILHHDLIMASYAVKTTYIPDTIGYIDQLPFVNVDRRVQYGTWQMSSDMGAIRGETLLKFRSNFGQIGNFDYLLNSIAKLGQQNGLFCYSAPALYKATEDCFSPKAKAGKKEVFQFIFSHYKSIRILLLFWHYYKFERSLAFFPLLRSLFTRKYFQKQVDLSGIEIRSVKKLCNDSTIDVIIPTMGRKDYLLQVMDDLQKQTLLPEKVVVIEQNPKIDSVSDLAELNSIKWPFQVIHHFTNRTGACNARNVALEEVISDWIFFADDDLRIQPDFLEKGLKELDKYKFNQITFDCREGGKPLIFKKIKQWGTFGAGSSIVAAKFVKNLRFDPAMEFGYGEDIDYGMQLRAKGCDIVFHPELQLLHLKAPVGGFREVQLQPWEGEDPKPSPTMLLLAKKYYTLEQLRGFRTELLLRYFPKQSIKNPFRYLKDMNRRWNLSEDWASKLAIRGVRAEKTNSLP